MHQITQQYLCVLNSYKGKKEIDPTQLVQNCVECINLAKSSLKKKKITNHEYEMFRLNTTEILLMCCSSVKETMDIDQKHNQYYFINNIYNIPDNTVLSVLRTLNSCKYFRGIVCWLPLETNCRLLNLQLGSEFLMNVDFVMAENLIYGLLFSAQLENYNDIFIATVNKIEIFLINALTSINFEKDLETAAFFIHCLITSIVFMLYFTSCQKLPTYSNMGIFYKISSKSDSIQTHENQINCIIKLVGIIFENLDSFGNKLQIVWNEFEKYKTCLFDFPQNLIIESLRDPNTPNNVQMHIASNANKILDFLKSDVSHISDLNNCKKFKNFLEKIALKTEDKLTESIFLKNLPLDEKLNKETMECILKSKEVFLYENYYLVLQKNLKYFDNNAIKIFVINAIEFGIEKDRVISSDWKKVILDFAQYLPTKVLAQIIKENLCNGSIEVLKKENFSECLTKVFNQLDSSENISTEFMLLGLQSGVEVVTQLLKHAFDMPGLEPVLMFLMEYLSCVFFSKNEKGSYITVVAFKIRIVELDSPEKYLSFISIANKILEIYNAQRTCTMSQEQESEFLKFPKDLVENILLSNLSCTRELLTMPCKATLTIFEVVMEMFPSVIFNPMVLVNSYITLILLYNNFFTYQFKESNYPHRKILSIIAVMNKKIKNDKRMYTKEIHVIRSILGKRCLHPHCYMLIMDLSFENELMAPTFVDEISNVLRNRKSDSSHLDTLAKDKYRWTYALIMILPYCDEQDWIRVLYATFNSLSIQGIFPKVKDTLQTMCFILITKCMDYQQSSFITEDIFDKQKSLFESFSYAVIKFVSGVLSNEKIEFKVKTICTIGVWWCINLNMFKFSHEVPTLFLDQLVNYLTEKLNELETEPKTKRSSNDHETDKLFISLRDGSAVDIRKFNKSLKSIPDSGLKSTILRKLENIIGS